MNVLTHGQVADTMLVTLNEKRTLTVGYYLFIFTNITTKQTVTKIYNFVEDNSAYTTRFNDFTINTSVVFASVPAGEWLYNVYEQASAVNTSPTGLTEVERGIIKLNLATEFAFKNYSAATTFKTYGG